MMTQTLVKRAADAVCRLAPSVVLHRVMNVEVVVLMYHVVSDDRLPHVVHLYPYKTPAEFALDMVYLKANHPILSFQEFENGCGRLCSSQPAILLTFDDGFSECYDVIRPILLRFGIPCTFFVTTSFIDNRYMFYRHKVSLCIERMRQITLFRRDLGLRLARINKQCGCELNSEDAFTRWIKGLRHADEDMIDSICEIVNVIPSRFLRERQPYLTSRQLEQLVSDGFTLGGHGRKHGDLADLCDLALIEAEIVESCNYVCRMTGRSRAPFAFPFTGQRISRQFLHEVMTRNNSVSFLFDTNGVAADIPRVANRVSADFPSTPTTIRSTLPELLRSSIEREGVARTVARVQRFLTRFST